MKSRYIPGVIMLTAGAITSLICIIRKFEVLFSLELLLGVLVVFAIIGVVVQKIILNVEKENKTQEEERIQQERLKQLEEEYNNDSQENQDMQEDDENIGEGSNKEED